jgi:hypothetical protein
MFVIITCTEFSEKKLVNDEVEIKSKSNLQKKTKTYTKDSIANSLLLKKTEALNYCKNNKLNTNLCFLLDMKIHSGKKRFFVYDFIKDSIIKSGLVAHGCGQNYWSSDESKDTPEFSNTPESHLSSLGKYKVGKRGWSNWGIHVNYLMHGLDTTNNNALKRQIVLHGWDLVTEEVVFPNGTVEGWGCPAVSNQFMTYLDSTLKKQNQPVLLWMYY